MNLKTRSCLNFRVADFHWPKLATVYFIFVPRIVFADYCPSLVCPISWHPLPFPVSKPPHSSWFPTALQGQPRRASIGTNTPLPPLFTRCYRRLSWCVISHWKGDPTAGSDCILLFPFHSGVDSGGRVPSRSQLRNAGQGRKWTRLLGHWLLQKERHHLQGELTALVMCVSLFNIAPDKIVVKRQIRFLLCEQERVDFQIR